MKNGVCLLYDADPARNGGKPITVMFAAPETLLRIMYGMPDWKKYPVVDSTELQTGLPVSMLMTCVDNIRFLKDDNHAKERVAGTRRYVS